MAESLTIPYLIKAILVALVVVVIIIFIFYPGVWQWFKDFLPDFIRDSGKIDEQQCKVKIGEIRLGKDIGKPKREYISFCYDNQCDSFYKSTLYFYNDKVLLDVRKGSIFPDEEEFAIIEKGRIVVDKNIFPDKYDKIVSDYGLTPSIKFLKILDNSYRLRNNNFLCRESELIELKKGADLTSIPKELKFKQEGELYKIFSDSFGYEVLVNKAINKIEKIVDKNNKEIVSIWVENAF